MPVYVSDLADHVMLSESDTRRLEYLYCPECGAEYSASKGDYWHLDENQKMRCASGHALTDLQLVVKRTVIERVM